jgi:hypothetical protein
LIDYDNSDSIINISALRRDPVTPPAGTPEPGLDIIVHHS